MVNSEILESALDVIDRLNAEAQRQVEYIVEQLMYRDREQADVVILTDRLHQLTKGAIHNA